MSSDAAPEPDDHHAADLRRYLGEGSAEAKPAQPVKGAL